MTTENTSNLDDWDVTPEEIEAAQNASRESLERYKATIDAHNERIRQSPTTTAAAATRAPIDGGESAIDGPAEAPDYAKLGELAAGEAAESPRPRSKKDARTLAAEAKLPEGWQAVFERNARYEPTADGGLTQKPYIAAEVADDLWPELEFFADPGADKTAKDFRAGGVWLLWDGERHIEPDMMDMVGALVRVCGTEHNGAYTDGSQRTKTHDCLNQLSLLKHRGRTLADLDANVPLKDRGSKKQLIQAACGTAISLDRDDCGEPVPHRRDQPLKKRLATAYNREATCPEWEESVRLWMAGKAEIGRTAAEIDGRVRFLQKALGYATLLPGNPAQKFFFFQGPGGDGKGVCLETTMDVVGREFSTPVKAAPFFEPLRGGGDEKVAELQSMEHKRAVIVAEAPKSRRWRTDIIKAATGDRGLSIRPMRAPEREIPVTWTMIFQGNVFPLASDDSAGWKRRLLLLIWDLNLPEDEFDLELPERLATEHEGILQWLVEGLRLYYAEGLQPPEDVVKATMQYQATFGSLINTWCGRCLEKAQGEDLSAGEAFTEFKHFAAAEEEKDIREIAATWKPRSFRTSLMEQGWKVENDGRQWVIRNCSIRLKTDPPPAPAGDHGTPDPASFQPRDALREAVADATPGPFDDEPDPKAAAEIDYFGGES